MPSDSFLARALLGDFRTFRLFSSLSHRYPEPKARIRGQSSALETQEETAMTQEQFEVRKERAERDVFELQA